MLDARKPNEVHRGRCHCGGVRFSVALVDGLQALLRTPQPGVAVFLGELCCLLCLLLLRGELWLILRIGSLLVLVAHSDPFVVELQPRLATA